MKRFAVVSVWDKTGLEPFVQALVKRDIGILSTGGTAKFLSERGISVISISDYTGHPEICEGRVKSLHPKIHGGILGRRDNPNDLRELAETQIELIDFVIVNLYPFTEKVAEIERAKDPNHDSLIEYIDIGGPTMIRAAAKNCEHVLPICDPSDYSAVIEALEGNNAVPIETRRKLATKVFATMAAYDGAVARYFALGEKLIDDSGNPITFSPVETVVLKAQEQLRYGENPHQQAGLYRRWVIGDESKEPFWRKLQGKELSYNNLLDMQAVLDLFLEISRVAALSKTAALPALHFAVIIKHSNPCGVAIRPTPLEAFQAARQCDPVSAFGGIVAVSGTMDKELAECVIEGFVEVVVVEAITSEAEAVFQKKKNVRLIVCSVNELQKEYAKGALSIRNSFGDFLLQSTDNSLLPVKVENLQSGKQPSSDMLFDMSFAWAICKHVKSNAIVIVKNRQAIGIGAGQMSRVDAARLSLQRAALHGHDVSGAVAASDAFLPFPDTLEVLSDGGIVGLVQPGGSLKDQGVIDVAEKRKVAMIFTSERHFRH